MSFIRKVKIGKHTYLQEVKNVWVNGKVKQKFIRHVGKEADNKKILSGSISSAEITQVKIYGPLLVLNEIAREIDLHSILGDYSSELLSMVYSHCIDPKSVNTMIDWFSRTELNHILNLEKLTERRLVDALDEIDIEERNKYYQNKIFDIVNSTYDLENDSFFYDVTNIYFFGVNCTLAKRSKSKEGGYKRLVQIGLAVTKEGVPIFHKVFSGNVFDARTLFDVMQSLPPTGIKMPYLVWDRGVSSNINISDAKRMGFEVICGLAIKGKLPQLIDKVIDNESLIQRKNRVQLKNSSFYVSLIRYWYENTIGYLYICLNRKHQVELQEKRLKEIEEARELIIKKKKIKDSLKKYFSKKKNVLEKVILEEDKYDGISIIFSTKKLSIKDLLKRYFDKDVVEKAFQCLKGVIKIRPVRMWLEERVKAHIFICYLSYLLLSLLDYKLKKKLSNFSALESLQILETMYKVYITDPKTKNNFIKTVMLTKDQEKILKAINKKLIKPSG